MKGLPLMIVLWSSSIAFADPVQRVAALDPPGLTPDRDTVPTASPPLDQILVRDAAGDRGAVGDTALVQPSGAVSATVRVTSQVGLATVSAGLGGGIELSLDAGKSFGDRSTTYAGTLKATVVRRARWQLAVEGSYRRVSIDCGDCIDDQQMLTGGAIATGCIDAACSTLLTFGAGVVVSDDDHDLAQALTAGIITGTGPLRLLGEAAWIGSHAFGFAGGRLGGARLALDVGALVAADDQKATIVPMVAVGGRL